jgi:hypothetical protein
LNIDPGCNSLPQVIEIIGGKAARGGPFIKGDNVPNFYLMNFKATTQRQKPPLSP